MPRSIWNGVISFGMVSIPVQLFTATESRDITFNQVHDVCQTRIRYQKYCHHCDRSVDQDEIDRGYEFARGQYVILTDDDFEQLPLASKHAIEVSAFVQAREIDPIYFEKSYYAEPDEVAHPPFNLFMRALTSMCMVAIGTITLRSKERLCALRPLGGTLVVETLLYPDEIRIQTDEPLSSARVNERELQMAHHLIELMAQKFEPEKYKDNYRDALKKVIEAKLDGKEIVYAQEAPKGKIVDLMEALRESVASLTSEPSASLDEARSDVRAARKKTRANKETKAPVRAAKKRSAGRTSRRKKRSA